MECVPHEINDSESKLPRIARIRLAQLRSGYIPLTNSYLSRLKSEVHNSSPDSNETPHDVHYFTAPKTRLA